MHIVKETLKAFKKPVFPITYENTSPHLRMISVNPGKQPDSTLAHANN